MVVTGREGEADNFIESPIIGKLSGDLFIAIARRAADSPVHALAHNWWDFRSSIGNIYELIVKMTRPLWES
jgi:hypothetical protein